jgi:hypothetical protein
MPLLFVVTMASQNPLGGGDWRQVMALTHQAGAPDFESYHPDRTLVLAPFGAFALNQRYSPPPSAWAKRRTKTAQRQLSCH